MAERRDVSIVIPTWNGRQLLDAFLPSVVEAAARYATESQARIEIVVVDDGGEDDTLGWLAARAADWPVVIRGFRQDRNLGFGAASNRGVREAAYNLVFLLNNDVAVAPDAIGPLVARFGEPAAGGALFAVHCRVLDFATGREVGTGKIGGFARGFLRVHKSYVTRDPAIRPLDSVFASGGSAMFDRSAFLALGGFDPLFAPFYLEDVEISYRAWKRGLRVGYEPRAVVRHRFSSTIEPLAGRQVPRIGQRNRLILHWIHLHDRRWLASHLCWVVILALAGPLTLKPWMTRAVLEAIGRLPQIRVRRRDERRAATRSDREVVAVFRAMAAHDGIRAYDDPRQLDGPEG